jgi:hypothetical protein
MREIMEEKKKDKTKVEEEPQEQGASISLLAKD